MSDADAGVVQSRLQLERLVASDELAGRTVQGFAARGALLRGVDLDGLIVERMDFCDADGEDARLERATINMTDARKSRWVGALWNRVQAKDSDLTQIDLSKAQVLRCELGPVRMARACFHGAAIQNTTFKASELYSADFSAAVLTRVVFDGYDGSTVSLSRSDFSGAALFDVDFRRANLYGAVFRQAMLFRCDLRGVNLSSADLRGARMVGCQTAGADLEDAQL
jgi:uncharacterized protein YjbI with pentapeptide repeats